MALDLPLDAFDRVVPTRSARNATASSVVRVRRAFPVGMIVVLAALAAPLVTWLPLLAMKFPALGLPIYNEALGTGIWMMHVFRLAVFAVIAWWIGKRDAWLAAAVLFAGLVLFYRGASINPTGADVFALSAMLVVATRSISKDWHGTIKTAIVVSGVFQALYVIFEMATQWDPLWDVALWQLPWHPWTPADGPVVLPVNQYLIRPLGTLARVDASMAWVAITAPLWPVWLLPVAALALWQGFSIGACAAFAVGITVRMLLTMERTSLDSFRWPLLGATAIGALGFAGIVTYLKGFATPVVLGRLEIWGFAMKHWSDPALIWPDRVMGWGIANWERVVPALQAREKFLPNNEYFLQAHNDYIQWALETGLIGTVLLAGWMWTNRAIFAHRLWGGSLVALAVNALTFFPFHVPALGLLGVSLIGLALATEVGHGG